MYRLASDDDGTQSLAPPRAIGEGQRESVASVSSVTSSMYNEGGSKYPSGPPVSRGLVAYVYDPEDESEDDDPWDELDAARDGGVNTAAAGSNPKGVRATTANAGKGGIPVRGISAYGSTFPWRGAANLGVLGTLVCALVALFVTYPVLDYYKNRTARNNVAGNIR